MTKRTINIILILIGTIGFISIFWWLNADPTKGFSVNLEGADNRGKGVPLQEVNIGEYFEEFASDYQVLEETWTNFRGADHDNISKSSVKLVESFGAEGSKFFGRKNWVKDTPELLFTKGWLMSSTTVKRSEPIFCAVFQ